MSESIRDMYKIIALVASGFTPLFQMGFSVYLVSQLLPYLMQAPSNADVKWASGTLGIVIGFWFGGIYARQRK